MTAEDLTEEAALAHKRARAYPEGWFQAAYGDELAPGAVRRLHYFGRELALFRTESGKAQIVDAFCAHLGAHLAVGGRVKGERLACPFHGWEYGTSGRCEHIPYGERLPARGAEVRHWPTHETAGIIFFWHSPADRPPQWDPPALEQHGQPDWGDYYLRRYFRVRTTCHEIAENIADAPHSFFVHGAPAVPPVTYEVEGTRFLATFENELPSVGGKAINAVTCHGLGVVENHGRGFGDKSFFSCYTPVDQDHVDVWFSMLARARSENDPTGEISRRSAQATTDEFAKDIPIWEAKIFRQNPLLIKEDGPIGRYRGWARQFFPVRGGRGDDRNGDADRAESVLEDAEPAAI